MANKRNLRLFPFWFILQECRRGRNLGRIVRGRVALRGAATFRGRPYRAEPLL